MPIWEPDKECMDAEQLQQLQLERLQATLNRVCRNVAFYQRCFKAIGFSPEVDLTDLKDLERLPFTTSKDISASYPYQMFAVPLREVREHQQGWIRISEMDPHGVRPRPHAACSRVATIAIPCETREATREANCHRRDVEETPSDHLLDARETRAVSQSRIQPREKSALRVRPMDWGTSLTRDEVTIVRENRE